ncbi:MAG TPA: hypothetical protein VFG42_01590 [Baekduia sp.]|uniref:hypothetical protein n=1 Tax=Baekduia sp. TaxID=2600305 RepID=UPI002D7A2C32|nr:hypothetical protein [Baekduia sp.]HET6505456.1 hypothetical protein [Baekduia sp.]
MSRFSRIVVCITALASLFAITSSTAGAVTWTNSGGTSFHATGGSVSLSLGGNLLGCSGSTTVGDAPVGTFTGAVYSISGTITYTPCSLIGNAAEMGCNFQWTGATWTDGAPAISSGAVDLTCVYRLATTGTPICHIAGTTPAHYYNPTATVPGRFTFTASTTLVATSASGTSCSAFGVPSGGSAPVGLNENTITIGSVATSPFLTHS